MYSHDHRQTVCKPAVTRFVAEDLHPQKRTDPAAKDCEPEQSPFRNAPAFLDCPVFIDPECGKCRKRHHTGKNQNDLYDWFNHTRFRSKLPDAEPDNSAAGGSIPKRPLPVDPCRHRIDTRTS